MGKAISLFAMICTFFLIPVFSGSVELWGGQGKYSGEFHEELQKLQLEIAGLRKEINEIRKDAAALFKRAWMSRYSLPRNIEFCGERVPLERIAVRERLDKEFLLAVDNIAQVLLWMKRSRRFFPYIEKVLMEKGLPEDLKYVVIIESALRTDAFSGKGAAGYWQFLRSTGSRYDIRKDRYVDERLDLVVSTGAAARYLKDLYDIFGNWALALAAYNAGEERVLYEIKAQRVKDYFLLKLPKETERYVFRAIAAKVILTKPQRYGFYLPDDEYYYAIPKDRIQIQVPGGYLNLMEIAEACNLTYKELKDLNPHLRNRGLSGGRYWINIPRGSSERVKKTLASLLKKHPPGGKIPPMQQKTIYRVRKGDTLWDIAERFKVFVESIQRWNELEPTEPIYPGQKLIIYRRKS